MKKNLSIIGARPQKHAPGQLQLQKTSKKNNALRSETGGVETLAGGWNTLMYKDLELLQPALNSPSGTDIQNLYGDNHAAGEIVLIIKQYI